MSDVNGNNDAVSLLQSFVDMAKRENSGYAVALTAREPGIFSGGFSGTVELEQVALEGLKTIQKNLEANILNRLPETDESLDDSYVCYNITCSPLSFDFTTWLIDQEMNRIRNKAPAPLKVGFWMGRNGRTGLTGDNSQRDGMLEHVCRPALKLLNAIEDPRAVKGKFKEFFSYRDIVKAHKDGETVPCFKSPLEGDIEPGYVTITLREASYWTDRNSKLKEWMMFADYLKNKGERVLFIRDTAKADEEVPGYKTLPRASRDLLYRMSVYENAKCNLFVSNGPSNLCVFSKKPFLMFFHVDPQCPYNAGRPEYWTTCAGISEGEQFPWLSDKQRMIWKPDFYTNMVVAWEELSLG